jgi:hypothetical protein
VRRVPLLLLFAIGWTLTNVDYGCAVIQEWIAAAERRLDPDLAERRAQRP